MLSDFYASSTSNLTTLWGMCYYFLVLKVKTWALERSSRPHHKADPQGPNSYPGKFETRGHIFNHWTPPLTPVDKHRLYHCQFQHVVIWQLNHQWLSTTWQMTKDKHLLEYLLSLYERRASGGSQVSKYLGCPLRTGPWGVSLDRGRRQWLPY